MRLPQHLCDDATRLGFGCYAIILHQLLILAARQLSERATREKLQVHQVVRVQDCTLPYRATLPSGYVRAFEPLVRHPG
jgi:hypothetical protein